MSESDSTRKKGGIHPKSIIDEFTTLPISRQRKWQLRQKKHACCTICGDPVEEVLVYRRIGFILHRHERCPKCREMEKQKLQFGDVTNVKFIKSDSSEPNQKSSEP